MEVESICRNLKLSESRQRPLELSNAIIDVSAADRLICTVGSTLSYDEVLNAFSGGTQRGVC